MEATSIGPSDRSHAARVSRHTTVSTALSLHSDQQLRALVDSAPMLGSGIGGTSVLLEVEGVPVFAKRVPLTDLERRPEHVRSTANIFELPTYCHYGIGSAGGGVWRELATHVMATNWVLGAQSEAFPLLYHWRVLDGPAPAPRSTDSTEKQAEIDDLVAYWDGSAAVRHRLEALADASASVVFFGEHLPHNLHDWLNAQVAAGDDAIDAACAMIERRLFADVGFMTAHGLMHFDAHFENILTDGTRLYLADYGLATSERFDLSASERRFVERNRSHDGCYVASHLVAWLVTALTGTTDPAQRRALVSRYAEGEKPAGIAASETYAADIIMRYAPISVVVGEFYRALREDSKATPYPDEELRRVCAAVGFSPVPE